MLLGGKLTNFLPERFEESRKINNIHFFLDGGGGGVIHGFNIVLDGGTPPQ